MTEEELFKKNFPEYVTEKGVFLSPYWDLFSAGYEIMEDYNEKLLNSDIEKHNKIVELEAQIDNLKSIGKTSYIKGIRTMANALKEYDRTEGAWTDYFEHKVDETLKVLLKRGVIKENLTTKAECETQELLDKQIEATYKVVERLNKAKNLLNEFVNWANWQGSKCPSFKSIQDKAEEFLKE